MRKARRDAEHWGSRPVATDAGGRGLRAAPGQAPLLAGLRRAAGPEEIAAAARAALAVLTACGEVDRAVLWPELARVPGARGPPRPAALSGIATSGALRSVIGLLAASSAC